MAGTINHLRPGQQLEQSSNAQSKKTQVAANKAEDGTVEKSGTKNDAVSISSESRAIGVLNQQIAGQDQFDAAKVDKIKSAIANGSYQIDADKLALNMLKFEDELSSKE
ncbi:flagellar biosynthesis anti-sigma factor FlgM [Veronia pacifica]|uniref:Negative regulator of flagellin synthesis n=1 Tax=Veronia pacifica TaxID=1080227 RepID=A0A1C3EEM1_9GAMM|nr:flagellar biosynthesis anti-sigma factor FlgM [Veronia pacifica]ODA31707.1 flagellar biosynthesis anti-sigma factor FlgM [Veronia pacifica]